MWPWAVLLGWGDRDLCFSDNSKDLKNKEIPGIQLGWDMESPWGTWLSCLPKLLGTELAPHASQDVPASSLRSRAGVRV